MAQDHLGYSNITTTAVKMILLLFHKHTKTENINFHRRVAQSANKYNLQNGKMSCNNFLKPHAA